MDPEADQRLRALRVLPAHVPDVRAVGRGDGLPARPDPPDEPARRGHADDAGDGRALRRLPGLHGVRDGVPVRGAVRPADRADPGGGRAGARTRPPQRAGGARRWSSACSPTRAGCGCCGWRCGWPGGWRRSWRGCTRASARWPGSRPPVAAAAAAAARGRGAGRAPGRGRHAHRVRAGRVLPAGQRGHGPGARAGGLRRGHPAAGRAAAGRCSCTPAGRSRPGGSPAARSGLRAGPASTRSWSTRPAAGRP